MCKGELQNEQRGLDGTVPRVQIVYRAVTIGFGEGREGGWRGGKLAYASSEDRHQQSH